MVRIGVLCRKWYGRDGIRLIYGIFFLYENSLSFILKVMKNNLKILRKSVNNYIFNN